MTDREKAGNLVLTQTESKCERSFAATLDVADLSLVSQEYSDTVGYGRIGRPRAFQLAGAPQPDSGTTWDSENRHTSL